MGEFGNLQGMAILSYILISFSPFYFHLSLSLSLHGLFADSSLFRLYAIHVQLDLCFLLYRQYMLYGPLVAKALYSWVYEDGDRYSWCLHILIICALRGLIYQLWSSYSNMLFLTRNRLIIKQGVDFKQIDMEWDW